MTSALDLLGEAMALVDAAERILAEERAQRWCPHVPMERQAEFLSLDVLEALYGGAAGGGKSDALLMAALQYVDVPGYSALILRKTYKDLALAGAIMDRAAEWWRPTAARWNDTDKRWTFPAGSSITFGYMETPSDRFRYQGAEFQCVIFDELTQFQEVCYTYLLSRLRKTTGALDRVPLRMRAGTNPGGIGHDWVGKRFGIQPDGTQDIEAARDPKTGEARVFVPAKLEDNPHVDSSYERSLSGLDAVTHAQLRHGVWVRDTTGLVLPLTEANFVDAAPAKLRTRLGIDAGSSATTETLSLVVVGWAEHRPHESWIVHAEKHPAMLLSALAERVRWLEERFDIEGIVLDEGALGAQFGRELRQRFGIPVRAAKKNNRLGYSWLMRDAARGASEPADRTDVPRLYVVRDACEPLVTEAAALLWHEDAKRMVGTCHAYDAALYAWRDVRAHTEEPAPAPKPAVGTPEHAAMLADDLKRRADAARDRKGRPFWQPRR
jgi:hypothetical protein